MTRAADVVGPTKMPNDAAYTITKATNDNVDRVRKIRGSPSA